MCAQVAACLLHFWLHGLDVRYGPPCPQYGDVQYGLDAQYRSGVQCDTATRTPLICSLLRRDTHARTHACTYTNTHTQTYMHTCTRTNTHAHTQFHEHAHTDMYVGLAIAVYLHHT